MSVETKNSLTSALDEAQNILNAAESKAEKILLKAKQEYESAKQNGFDAGIELGKQQATTSAVRLIQDAGSISDKLSEQAALLALAIAEDVIGKAIELNPKLVTEIALKALKESVIGSNVRIIANPEDIKALEEAKQEMQKHCANLSIEAENSITRGGCIIKTDFGEVDSQISTLIQMIKKKLELHE